MSAKIKEDQLKFRNGKSVDSQWIYAAREETEWQLPKWIDDKLNSSPKRSEKSKSLANNEFRSDNDQRQDAEIISGDKIESMTVRSTQDNQGQVQSGTTIVTRLLPTRRMIQCNFCLETRYSMQYYSTSNRKIKSCLNCLDKFKRWLIQAPPTSPEIQCHSTSESRAHPCPKDDANQHMFHSHELRKFPKSCQQPEQVGVSTKPMSPTESYQPRTTWVRPTSPAYDAKPHTFHDNEFPKATELRAKINGPKPNDNKATVNELPKQNNWINRQRHESKSPSRMKNQEIPMFSSNIRKIGNQNIFKVYESGEFRNSMENQYDITMSSISQWEPEKQRFQRSMFGYPVNINIQCRSEHQDILFDNTSLRKNQWQSIEWIKIENRKPELLKSIFDKGCEIEKVANECNYKEDNSTSCQEMGKYRLAFDSPRKSNVWRVRQHQKLFENSSSTLNNTINSNDLESFRPKMENQRKGQKFTKFEDQLPRYEVPVYTAYDQEMGFDIGKKCIIGHQGYSGPYLPRQYEKCSQDTLESSKEMDASNSNVVSQRSTLDNPINPYDRWRAKSQNLEIQLRFDVKLNKPISSGKLKFGTQFKIGLEVEEQNKGPVTAKTQLECSANGTGHHHVVNKIHQRVQRTHRLTWFHTLFGVKIDKLHMALRWLNSKHQRCNQFVENRMEHILSMDVDRWQWIPTRFESSNRCFVYQKKVHWPKKKRLKIEKVEAEIFCSSFIASKVKVIILDYQESSVPPSIGNRQSFKLDRWIIRSKGKTVLSWLKPQVTTWTKPHMGRISKRLIISMRIGCCGHVRKVKIQMILKPKLGSAHKLAVLGVIQQEDGLAQGLDRETGGSVRISASSTDSKFQTARTCHKYFRTSRSAELKFEEMAETEQANGGNVTIVKLLNKNSFIY